MTTAQTDYNGHPTRAAALTDLFRRAPRADDPEQFRQYAHALLTLGVALVLVAAGEKDARHKKWQDHPITTPEQFDAQYVDGMNLGAHLGQSNLIAVDADTPEAVAGFSKWWDEHRTGATLRRPCARRAIGTPTAR